MTGGDWIIIGIGIIGLAVALPDIIADVCNWFGVRQLGKPEGFPILPPTSAPLAPGTTFSSADDAKADGANRPANRGG